jgi:hypothetical protein
MAVYVGLVRVHVGLPAVPSRRDIAGAAPGRLVTVQVLAPEPSLVAFALKERGQGAPVKALLTEALRASARLRVVVVYEARVVRVLALEDRGPRRAAQGSRDQGVGEARAFGDPRGIERGAREDGFVEVVSQDEDHIGPAL